MFGKVNIYSFYFVFVCTKLVLHCVKVRLLKKCVFIYFNESHLKVMKDAFYLMSNTLPLLEYLQFCPDFLFMYKNGLIRKLWLIPKFMTSQTGQKELKYAYCPISQEEKSTRQ